MKKAGKIILFGFLIWISIFIGAMFMFSIHETDRIFFETLISVICTFSIIICTCIYFNKVQTNFLNEGIKIGLVWTIINIAIDLPLFSFGPMALPLLEYFKDIGFMYLSIPIITISVGYILNKKTIK